MFEHHFPFVSIVVSTCVALAGCGTSAGDCGRSVPNVGGISVTDARGAISRPPVGDALTLTAIPVADPDSVPDGVCGSSPLAPATYEWTVTSAPSGYEQSPAVFASTEASTPFVPNVAGTYVVSVTAVSSSGIRSEPVSVTVATGTCGPEVANTAAGTPIDANGVAPDAFSAPAGTLVQLGVGAFSSSCVVGGYEPTLAWHLVSRPADSGAALDGSTSFAPRFVADVPGSYAIELVVTDNGGFSSVYRANLTVGGCTPPSIVAAADADIAFVATGADSTSDPSAITLISDTMYTGDRVTISLPVTSGARPGSCGPVAAYEWVMISRPSGSQATLFDASAATPTFVPDVAGGTYQFAVVVRDGQGNASAPAFFSATVDRCGSYPPSLAADALAISAGPRVRAPFTATSAAAQDGNAACPLRLRASSYTYEFDVSPAAEVSGGGASPQAQITAASGGTYVVSVRATSSLGLTSPPISTSVLVSACGSYPPVASSFALSQAVPNRTGTTTALGDFPVTGATATAGGSATSAVAYYVGVPIAVMPTLTDADSGSSCAEFALPAEPVSYEWSFVGTPANSQLELSGARATSSVGSFTPDVPGTFTLSLTTRDSAGDASTSVVTFNVSCGAASPAIGALVGSQTQSSITVSTPSPMNVGAPILLQAMTTDADATAAGACTVAEAQPLTYHWTFASVPPGSQATLIGPDTASPSFVPDVATTSTTPSMPYLVRLTVTDPQGHSTTSQLSISVP